VKRREAQRLLAEAEAVEAGTWRCGEWIERNAGVHRNLGFNAIPGFRHVGWDSVETMTPPPRPEEDGMGGLRPVLVDVPSLPAWDAEQQRRALEYERQARRKEQLEHPERFVKQEATP